MKSWSGVAKSVLGFGLLAQLVGCGASQDASDVSVTNGREVKDGEYPSVVLLYDQSAGAICTGTFVSPTRVLTAAHCTMSGEVDAEGRVADLKLAIIKIADPVNKKAELIGTSTAVFRNPLWDKNGKNVNKYDLGVVEFAPGVSKAVSQLAAGAPAVGESLTIVGYGLNQTTNMNDPASAGVKRVGVNKVASLADGFIQFTGANKTSNGNGTNSSAASGDSGGPLFINGKVAGVTSGGGFGGFGSTRSLYVNLSSPESKAFLSKVLN